VIEDLSDALGLKGNAAAWQFDGGGRILVSEQLASSTTYFWYDPADQSLETIHVFPQGTFSLRNAVADNRTVAFSWSQASGESFAARWSMEHGFESIALPKDMLGFSVTDINASGHFTGSAFELPFYNQVALLCGDGVALERLDQFLPNHTFDSHGIAINSAGQILLRSEYFHWILSPRCQGDVDGDGYTNVTDLLLAIASWGTDGGGACGPDIDGDGVVNINDLLLIIAAWGNCH